MLKQLISLAICCAILLSCVIITAAKQDPVRAGEGNGTSETVENVQQLSDLLSNLPSASDYYSRFSAEQGEEGEEGGEGEEGEETDFLSDGFKPLILRVEDDLTQYTEFNSSDDKVLVSSDDVNLLPEDTNSRLVLSEETTSISRKSNLRQFVRDMKIYYLKDALLFVTDATITTGSEESVRVTKTNYYGTGSKHISNYYYKDEFGDWNVIPEDQYYELPEEVEKTYTYYYEGRNVRPSDPPKAETTVTTQTQTTHIVASLYLRQGKIFMKYDAYSIDYVNMTEVFNTQNDDLISREMHDPTDEQMRDRATTQMIVDAINGKFLGQWIDLHHKSAHSQEEIEELLNKDPESMSQAEMEEVGRQMMEAQIGGMVNEIGEKLVATLIQQVDESASSYASLTQSLLNMADSIKPGSVTSYQSGRPEDADIFLDFALDFLSGANIYNRDTYERENSEENHSSGNSLTYTRPHGNICISFLNPTAPTVSYAIKDVSVRFGSSANKLDLYEKITISGVGNTVVTGPESVKKDLYDLFYSVIMDSFNQQQEEHKS